MKLTDPSAQLGEFWVAFLVGLCLGLLFDICTVLGRKRGFFRHGFDLLFALGVLLGNVYLFLQCGRGSFELFYLLGMGSGFLLWRKSLGRVFLPVFGKIYAFIGAVIGEILGIPKKIIKKSKFFLKKLFSNRKKSVTIKERRKGKEAT